MMDVRLRRPGPPYLRLLILSLLLLMPLPAAAADQRQEVLDRTAANRGLAVRAEVPLELVDRGRLRESLEARLDEDVRASILVSQKLMQDLGLLSADQDLRRIYLDTQSGGVAGYYSSREKRMFVVTGEQSLGPSERLTLSHEFTHALQDQHFDLVALRKATGGDDDRLLGLKALVEGDAVISSVEYARATFNDEDRRQLTAQRERAGPPPLQSAPQALREEILFPYRAGTAFVRLLRESGGFAAVDRAFGDPPNSSEQVLHPEKYAQHEPPVEVRLPDLAAGLGEDWTVLRSNVLGELDLKLVLQQYSESTAAEQGAAGWGGDRYALLERADGARLLVVRTVWDDEAEAGQFFAAYAATVQRRFGEAATRQPVAADRVLWTLPAGALSLAQAGTQIEIVQAPDPATLDRALELLASPS